MLPLGTLAPDFSLQAPDGSTHGFDGCNGSHGTLVVFMCNHCPYVKHIYEELAKLGTDCLTLNIGMVGIMSNDIENYPDDAPDKMAETAAANGWTFPYLFDADQSVAKAYTAACTPDFFLFDANKALVYRGQLDDSRPKSDIPVDGKDLRQALNALASGEPISTEQKPALGCGIKWAPGQAPAYMGGVS
jgi:peroxiredoxin